MNQRLRKVVGLSTSDLGSGAERVAWSLHKALQRKGIESWLLVGEKRSDDPFVLPLWLSPFFDYRPFDNHELQTQLSDARVRDRQAGIEDFNFPYSWHVGQLTGSQPDLVLCHNLHGDYFDPTALADLSRRVPTIVSIHDFWLFTGHCAHPMACQKWRTGCGGCPDLHRNPSILADATHFNWLRKKAVFRDASFWVSCPSSWAADRVRESTLAQAARDIRIIPYPIDLQTFFPGAASVARASLNLPRHALIVVFLANHGRDAAYKDFPTLMSAITALGSLELDRPVIFIGLGHEAPPSVMGNVELRFVPFQPSEVVASYFRAADVFVQSSRIETFGLGIAEAMACGTAVVTSDVGGTSAVVNGGELGVLVPPMDADALSASLAALLQDPDRRARLGQRGVAHARTQWADARVADLYCEWFGEIRGDFPHFGD